MWPLPARMASSEYGRSFSSEDSLGLRTRLSHPPSLRPGTMTHQTAVPSMETQPSLNASQIPAPCMRAIPATALSCGASPTGCTRGTSRTSWSCVGLLPSLCYRRPWTKLSSCGISVWMNACAPSGMLLPPLLLCDVGDSPCHDAF